MFTALLSASSPYSVLEYKLHKAGIFVLLTNVVQVPRTMCGKYQALTKYLMNESVNVGFLI